jgi:hypothetical protein
MEEVRYKCGRSKCDKLDENGYCSVGVLSGEFIDSVYSGENVCNNLRRWVLSQELRDEEIIVKEGSTVGGERHIHPSFGMLCFNRQSGGSPYLFGSSIKHHDKINLVLKRGEYDRHLNQNWYFGTEELFEVEMSYTQFVELITHMNMGDGVPVTLKRVNHKAMPECPYHNPLDVHREEYKEHLEDVYSDSKELIKTVEGKFKEKKSFNKKEQEEILSMLRRISQNIGTNQEFQLSQFNEQMDNTVAESKGEIEAFMQHKMYQIAQQALVENPESILKEPVYVPQIEESPKKKLKKVTNTANSEV